MAALLSTENLRIKGLPTLKGKGSRLGFRAWFIPVAIVLLGTVAWWTRSSLEATLKGRISEELETIRDTELAAVRIWLESQADAAANLNEIPDVERLTSVIAAAATTIGDDPEALHALPESTELVAILTPLTERLEFTGWGVLDRSGLLIATPDAVTTGRRLSTERLSTVAQAFRGETLITHPFLSLFAADDEAQTRGGRPTMFVVAPVRDDADEVIAVIGYVIDVDSFTRILGIARAGESGETYAFDADGTLLSHSRFDDELRAIGLLPEDPQVGSALNIEIRNPGVNLTTGETTTTTRRAQPLTRMAASAISGETSIDVEGYNDYRGVPVVGAWAWLDEYEFGITSEQDLDEAYQALNSLKRVQDVLFAVIGFGGVALLFGSLIIARLGKQVTEAVMEAQQLGQYTLEKKIGEGGMGEVHRARHAMLRRPTAIKLLRPDRTTETEVARFEREVQLTAQLTHPNTIAIYDFGRTPDNIFYYAMEYLHGIDLQDLVDHTGPLPPERVIEILGQACRSLAEAHEISLIHRDIKPANLMLCNRGGEYDVVKVVDFGIVKQLGMAGDAQLTQEGAFTGTPHYLAPETLSAAGEVDAAVDVYALGAVGYFLLTGTNLFSGDDPITILTAQVATAPDPPSARVETHVPADLERLILLCLEKDPADRPPSARDLADRLAQLENAGQWTQPKARDWWSLHVDLAGYSTRGEATEQVDCTQPIAGSDGER